MSILQKAFVTLISFATFTIQAQAIHCTSNMPANSEQEKTIFIKKWASMVAQKSFSLSHPNLEQQLKELQTCYSNTGWEQFNKALDKSENLKIIHQYQLQANTQILGPIQIKHSALSSKWIAWIPLRVVYQNYQQKISQTLKVQLSIEELKDKHLATIQIIGNPI